MIPSAPVKKIALNFGFDEVGISSLDSFHEAEQAIEAWTAEGKHGTMSYMENFRARKEQFFQDFQDAKSVISLGVNYFTRDKGKGDGPPTTDDAEALSQTPQPEALLTGRIARYAWGQDYHQVIAARHQMLISKLQETFGASFRAKSCVDIQPVPERFAARQAGLGFLGKHTGLLSKQFGPWLFLSEIITNLDLETDSPAQGDCGTCVHCQRICPTGALDQDYQLDARLCIAYLTIEHKGVIPRELRPKIKDWLFGCDECFDVCPFTAKSKESQWPELGPESGVGTRIDLAELFSIKSNSEYEKKFSRTALSRNNRKQLLRNACVVMGNRRDPQSLPYLYQALTDSAPLVRLHAAWALGQFQTSETRRELTLRLSGEVDSQVLEEIRFVLSELK